MKLKMLLIAVMVLCAALSACNNEGKENRPKIEVSSYSEKTLEAKLPLQLNLECENSNIQIYSWNKKEIKFEMTRRIRGIESKANLMKHLDVFDINISMEDNRASLVYKYNGNNVKPAENILDLKVYIPKKTGYINCIQKNGKLKFFDDVNCDVNIDTGTVDVEMNSFEGKLLYKSQSGDLRISEGKIKNESNINIIKGNIRIKAKFEPAGSYNFKTGTGILELCLPDNTNAIVEATGQFETVKLEEGELPAYFRLQSDIGKISITKF